MDDQCVLLPGAPQFTFNLSMTTTYKNVRYSFCSQAIEVDTIEENSHCSSMLDDVFFILKKCLKRAFSSASVDGACAMLNHSCSLLETDFAEELSERLKLGFPPSGLLDLSQAYSMIQSSFQQGRIQPAESADKARAVFLTTLNNVEMAREYTKTLATSLQVS